MADDPRPVHRFDVRGQMVFHLANGRQILVALATIDGQAGDYWLLRTQNAGVIENMALSAEAMDALLAARNSLTRTAFPLDVQVLG